MAPINRRVVAIVPGPPGPEGPAGPAGPAGPSGPPGDSAGDVFPITVPDDIDATGIPSGTTYLRGDGAWGGLGALADQDTITVPTDITATGTPSASTSLHGDGAWRAPTAVARVSVTDPEDPQPGDMRWNLLLDPPTTGTDYTDADTYLASKAQLVGGTNVTLVPDDNAETITINATASGGTGDSLFTALNATDYGLSTSASAAVNKAALQACINAALAANRNVFIPAGTYIVNPDCLTPTLGSAKSGIEIIGEGKYRTVLQMATQTSESYFYDNKTNGTTLSFAVFIDIGFQGGPTSTGTERANINANHHGFRLYGPTDQSFKFFRCRFGTLNGVWYSAGANNASEVTFDNCKISHIQDHVWRISNFQALNLNSVNSDIEFIWGDVVRTEGTGGGAVNFTMGSIIVQDDGSDSGCLVKLNAQQSSTVTFMGCRIEVRNAAKLVDGSGSTDVANVNFISCGTFTTAGSGIAVNTVIVNTNQAVTFDKCTFEHNGSYATYTVLGDGWLIHRDCAVRSSIASEISVSASGTAKGINCRTRFGGQALVEWNL